MTVSPSDQPAAEASALQQVIAALQRSDRAPVPVDTSGISAGQWVSVNRSFTCTTLAGKAVCFLDRDPHANAPDASQVRVLLHGSAENLLQPYEAVRTGILTILGSDAPFVIRGSSLGVIRIIEALGHSFIDSGSAEESWEALESALYVNWHERTNPRLADDWIEVSRFTAFLDSFMPFELYSPMSSLARVTAVLPYHRRIDPAAWGASAFERCGTLVVATPLFVEHAPSPTASGPKKRRSP
jgi:hypothetical protein